MNTTERPANNEVILAVEDSPTQLEKLLFILKDHGFRTMAATNGKEALERIAREIPTIIISDVVMPEMNGYELCGRIKGDDRTKYIPVILLTALSDPKDVLKGLECGADNFITKPYNENYLVSRIQSILANMRLRESKITRMGIEISFGGENYFITSERQQILDLLLSTYEAAVQKNSELLEAQDALRHLNEQLEEKVRERTAKLRQEVEERRLAEEKVVRLNRLYSVLSLCNQAIIRLTGRQELLERICRVAIEVGKFRLAWIGMVDQETGRLKVVARLGHDDGYLDKLIAAVNDTRQDHSPAVDALRNGKQLSCCDARDNTCLLPWREEALQHGFLAYATFPLFIEQRFVGSLNVYAPESLFFDEKETNLLQEVANDLSFALTSLEHEDLRRKIEGERKKLSFAVEQSSDWILITDSDDKITYVNKAVEEISGYTRNELMGLSPTLFLADEHDRLKSAEMQEAISDGKTFQGIITSRKKNGRLFELYYSVSPLNDENGTITHFVYTAKDITQQRLLEERLDYLAYHDALTGLPNRGLFLDRLNRDLVKADADARPVAVLHIDINGFKTINDAFGAAVGDQVLIEIGKRLADSVREGDTVARYLNDEFRISLAGLTGSEDVILTAEKIITGISQPMVIEGEEIAITINMGLAVYPGDGKTAENLLHKAAVALEKAKEVGRQGYYFYTPSLDAEANEYLLVKRHLFNALKKEEFVLHYQPYFDLATRKMVGMESLIRWQSADLGQLVPPGRFVPILEDTRLVVEVGEWAMETAARQVKEWQQKGLPVVPVSVNLSMIQFREKGLFTAMGKIIEEAGLSPGMLTLEITESAFMKDIGLTISVLKDFKDKGFAISIDDFGTGYSSLSYLKRFPVDNLKIDISFVRDITTDPDAASIITAIIAMAHGLNIKTIAEGVETQEQWNILRLLRCDIGQGYLFSKPLPAVEVEQLMQAT